MKPMLWGARTPSRVAGVVAGITSGLLTWVFWRLLTGQWHLAVAVPGLVGGILMYWKPTPAPSQTVVQGKIRTTDPWEPGGSATS
jgi:hypothetical protein